MNDRHTTPRVIAHSELVDDEGKSKGRRIAVTDVFDGDLVLVHLDVDEKHEGGDETWAHIDEIGKPKSVVTDVAAHIASMPATQLERLDPETHAVLFGVKGKDRDAFVASRSIALEAHARRKAEDSAKREAAAVLRREAEERAAAEDHARLEERLRAMMREEIAAASPATAETAPSEPAEEGPPPMTRRLPPRRGRGR
jgi:hypothetical protein